MADWYGAARSNYFKVKDLDAFKAALAAKGMTDTLKIATDDNQPGKIALLSEDDKGGWPSSYYDEDEDDFPEFDVAELVAPHLVDGEVAVFMESGAEKLRYVSGHAIAINSQGERREIDLNDIYDLATKQLGGSPTLATY